MVRTIIKIDEEKCNGCGICVSACHEGAIALVDGKAKLIRDDYCDGLGNCLPVCPTQAISFEQREAAAFDEQAVKANAMAQEPLACGCPGSNSKSISRSSSCEHSAQPSQVESELSQWPVQIKLVPSNAAYFNNANILVAADCTAFAYGNFHSEFMRNKITLIGCPKLDNVDYTDKLTEIIAGNNIKSITVVRMEVPCCGGIEHAVKSALQNSGKMIPWQIITISTEGNIIEN